MIKKILLFLSLVLIYESCSKTININVEDKRLTFIRNNYPDSNGILRYHGMILGELQLIIKFKKILLTKRTVSINMEGSLLDNTTLQPIPNTELFLIKNKKETALTKTDSFGKFSFDTAIDTNSILYVEFEGYQSLAYHIGNLLKNNR